jgi:hypothetical protein
MQPGPDISLNMPFVLGLKDSQNVNYNFAHSPTISPWLTEIFNSSGNDYRMDVSRESKMENRTQERVERMKKY